MNIENSKAQLRKGILEFCVLALLQKEEAYPSDVLQSLKEAELIVVEGTLYPLLNRLKNAGLLTYRWEESKSGPPRKYYTITDAGKTTAKEQSRLLLHRLFRSMGRQTHPRQAQKHQSTPYRCPPNSSQNCYCKS